MTYKVTGEVRGTRIDEHGFETDDDAIAYASSIIDGDVDATIEVERDDADDLRYLYSHAKAYALAEGLYDADAAQYGSWYVTTFGDDGIERAPSHRTYFFTWLREREASL